MAERRNAADALEWVRSGAVQPGPGLVDDADADSRAADLAHAFTVAPGALQTILEMTLFRPPVDYRLQGEEFARYALIREGQNGVAAAILKYLDAHETQQRNPQHASSPVPAAPRPEGPGGGGDGRLVDSDGGLTDPSFRVG